MILESFVFEGLTELRECLTGPLRNYDNVDIKDGNGLPVSGDSKRIALAMQVVNKIDPMARMLRKLAESKQVADMAAMADNGMIPAEVLKQMGCPDHLLEKLKKRGQQLPDDDDVLKNAEPSADKPFGFAAARNDKKE